MDDGDRCLLDVISDPLALEFFLGSGRELKPGVQLDEHIHQVTQSYTIVKTADVLPLAAENHDQVSLLSSVPTSSLNAAINNVSLAPPSLSSSSSKQLDLVSNSAQQHQATNSTYVQQQGVPSPAPSLPFQTAGYSPAFTVVSKPPMPPPPPSPGSARRSPAQAQVHSMHCPSPSGYPVTQSPSTGYQVRSPASSPLPSTVSFAHARTPTPIPTMPPTAISFIQQAQGQPQQVRSSVAASSLPANAIMQIIPAAAQPHGTAVVRHQHSSVRSIQPRQPQQILPKPAGGAPTQPVYGKSMTLAPNRATSAAVSLAGQGNPLVIGQGQAMLPNSANVTVGPQGTLVLNHINLGVGQSPILFSGAAAGLPPNVQLLLRSPQTTAAPTSTSQITAPGVNNAAMLTTLQVQNQAPQQAAFLGQTTTNKTAVGQGQAAMVIPGQSLGGAQSAQLVGQTLRPNLIGGQRMVSQMAQPQASPLVLQQIQTPQGPITVAISATQLQALQSCGLGIGSPSLTLASPQPSATPAGLGVIQGQNFQGSTSSTPSLSQNLVFNSQPVSAAASITSNASTFVSAFGDPSTHQLQAVPQELPQAVTQLSQQPTTHSEQPSQPTQQQQDQQQQPKLQSVNLEELLKQAGIVPDDTPSSPPPPPAAPPPPPPAPPPLPPPAPTAVIQTLPQAQSVQTGSSGVEQLPPSVVAFSSVPVMTKQCMPTVNGAQTMVVSDATGQSQMFAHLQQPLMAASHNQAQVRLTMGQDGSFYIQRPVFTQTQDGSFVAHHGIPVATTTATNQAIHSMLLQQLGATSAQQIQVATEQPAQQLMATSDMIPLAMHGIVTSNPLPPQDNSGIVVASSANAILSSMLNNPILTQATIQEPLIVTASDGSSSLMVAPTAAPTTKKKSVASSVCNRAAVIQQNPLLVRSLQGVGSSTPNVTSHTPSSAANQPVVCATSTAVPRPPGQSVIMGAGYPFAGVQPGHKVQTIQLTPQLQEALQKVQIQLRAFSTHKTLTVQQQQQLQQLHVEQQKILGQGKVISVHQQPIVGQSSQLQQQHNTQSPATTTGYRQTTPKSKSSMARNRLVAQSSSASKYGSSSSLTNLLSSSVAAPLAGAKDVKSAAQATSTLPNTVPTILATTTTATTSVTTCAATHVKIGNQIVALTSQQQRQVIKCEQQQPPLPQHNSSAKQALFLKLQQHQQQQQVVVTQLSQNVPSTAQQQGPALALTTNGILQTQTTVPSVTHLKSGVTSSEQQQLGRGIKRPASSTPATRAKAILQRLTYDQNAVLNPDYRTPFRSREDACQRLLQYHSLKSQMWSEEEIRKDEEHFEAVSKRYFERMNQMLNKYRYLLIRESMRETTTAEKVMLERIFIQDEMMSLDRDRKAVREGLVLDLPSPPGHWMMKKIKDPTENEEDEEDDDNKDTKKDVFGAKIECKTGDDTFIPVTIKQEPPDDSSLIQQQQSQLHGNVRGVADYYVSCKQEVVEEDDRTPHTKNYDEWAEIQKELEMYPLENEEDSSAGPMEFDPTDDTSHASLDFEPPVSTHLKDNQTARTSSDSYSSAENFQLHHHRHHVVTGVLHQSKSQHVDVVNVSMDWNDGFRVVDGDDGRHHPVDMEVMEQALSRRDQHHQVHVSHEAMSDLLDSTFKSPDCTSLNFGDVIVNGSFDRLQDDDLNAQVQSAINSILNLQRIEESRDAYIMYQQQQQQRHLTAQLQGYLESPSTCTIQVHREEYSNDSTMVLQSSNPGTPVGGTEDDIDSDGAVVDRSRFDFDVEPGADKVVTAEEEDEEEEEEDMVGIDYEANNMEGYDGPSEMDVALDEAVKSILL